MTPSGTEEDGPDETFEATYLRKHPDLERSVQDSPEFHRWRLSLGEPVHGFPKPVYILDGDIVADEEQIRFRWAYQRGLIPDADPLPGTDDSPL